MKKVDLYQKPLMQKDYFWLLHMMCVGIFSKKFVRIVLKSSLAMQIAIYIFETCIYITEPSYIIIYAPFLIARSYGTAAAFTILWKRNVVENLWQDFDLWSVDGTTTGNRAGVKYKEFSKNSKLIVHCTLAIGFLSCVLFTFTPTDVSVQYSLFLYMVQKWVPNNNGVLMVLLKWAVTPILYAMIVHPFLMLYASLQARLQGYMLADIINNITEDCEKTKPDDLVDDRPFQREMDRRLRFIIARHIQFTKLIRKATVELVTPLFLILAGFGFVLGLCVVVIAYNIRLNVYHFDFQSKVLLFLVGNLVVFCYSYLIHSGQAAVNTSEEIYMEITGIKWYEFNKANRMTLMVMIQNSMEPIKLKFTTHLAVDYDLGIRMAKGLYSAISLLMSLHLKQKTK